MQAVKGLSVRPLSNHINPLGSPTAPPSLQAAKALLRRGAPITEARDVSGATPWDAALAAGRIEDSELFVMLSSRQ